MDTANPARLPFIYNLFPPLAGTVDRWGDHVTRAVGMGFNWVFLNPIQYPGESGSLYSIRDYHRLNPSFFPQGSTEEQFVAFERFVESSRAMGMEVMVDLVVNHTAHDSPLVHEHPAWYKWLDDGTVAHPGAMDNGHWVIWGDLSEIDNDCSSDKAGLYEYWWDRVREMIERGVRGFRCDAAYKVPHELWRLLIGRAKEIDPSCTFFAESLGCPFEDNLALTESGFDYTFNSGKWWDYRESWFLDQLREGCGRTRSICFPESHDTVRLMEEWRGDRNRVEQHYRFTALISSGVMTVCGFEYGFKRQCHVVKSRPEDWEEISADLTDGISATNAFKREHVIFQEDNYVEKVAVGTDNVLCLKKTRLDHQESVLILINRYGQRHGVVLPGDTGEGRLLFGECDWSGSEAVLPPWG
ncbi:MAG: alpha-amylase family glycosyl hydrolase, partial [Planctomycetota bacterium]